jgi:DNA-binding NtrC family response regulator
LRQRVGKHEIVWTSEAMRRVMAQIERVGPTASRVYIHGETGTGKELVARALHECSPRKKAPFVTVNCAAVPAELIESELFGHEKGSFTGASARYLGKFEQAHGGTLFLDEIGDMPFGMQAKLLRVLEEGEIERIGADHPITVDVRVLTATHRNIEELVQKSQFRQDLYHRIYVFPLMLPPLRERMDDIPALVEHFSRQIALQNSWKPKSFTSEAIEELSSYDWPGNIRELRNVVERLLLLADEEVARKTVQSGLPFSARSISSAQSTGGALSERMEAYEREVVKMELERHHYRMTETAKALGLERSHLYKKCQQLGIDLHSHRRAPDLD